jgi:uncharacterized protein (TIGR03067 family)
MRTLATLLLGLGVVPVATTAAPVPNVPPVPTLEGKYTVLGQGRTVVGKRGFGGPAGLAADDERGFVASASALRRDVTITRDTISMESRTGATTTWEYRLDASTKPMSIDLVIVPLIGKKSKAHGIVELAGERVKVAYTPEGSERPKDFDDTENAVVYVFQKVPPPPRTEYKIVTLKAGKEDEAEKRLNELARDGFEISHSTTPGRGGDDQVIHLILKRTVSAK